MLQKFFYFYKPFVLFALVFSSCSKSDLSLQPRTLRISLLTYPNTTDPRKCADFTSSTLVCLIYEGLTRTLPEGGVEKALAERVELSEDRKTFLFYLRKAYWTNNQPITAYDFEKSWKEVVFPAKPCAFLFYPIKNAEAIVKGQMPIDQLGVTALNEQVLKVELERPTPYFYSLTAFPSFYPAPQEKSVFSGPFFIQKSLDHEIILKKNPLFWRASQIELNQIQISVVPDEATALQMFEKNELDFLGGPLCPLPPDALEKWKDKLIFIPNAASTFCTFNTQTFPFENLHLRKALSFAIDREEIVHQVTQSGQTPAGSILPPVFTHLNTPLFDLEKAKSHFEKALEELQIQPKDLEKISLYFKPSQVEKRVAQVLQSQWKRAFGVAVRLVQLDFKSHAQQLQTKNYQLSLASWIAQFDDPISILQRFKDPTQLKNYPGWENHSYNALLKEASESNQRETLLQEAEEILIREMPICPIYHWNSPAIQNARFEKIPITPSGAVLFERFQLAKK